MGISFPKQTKDLDPSCKTDLDFGECFGMGKLCCIVKKIGSRTVNVFLKTTMKHSRVFQVLKSYLINTIKHLQVTAYTFINING